MLAMYVNTKPNRSCRDRVPGLRLERGTLRDLSLAKIRSRRWEQLILVLGINPWNGFSAAEGTRTNALSCEAVPRGSQRTWQIYFSRRSNSPTLRDVQRISSGCQIVTMMKTSEPWHRCNLATDTGILSCLSPAGRSLRQREMRSVFMVVTNVFADQAFQMPFVENNHMVKQVPSAIANPTLCNTVLPRTSEAGSDRLH